MTRSKLIKKLTTFLRIGQIESFYGFIMMSAQIIYGEKPEEMYMKEVATSVIQNFFGLIPNDMVTEILAFLINGKEDNSTEQGAICQFCGKRRSIMKSLQDTKSGNEVKICPYCIKLLKETVFR